MSEEKKNHCLHSGLLCCFTACDFDKVVLGCVGSHDCLCLRHSFCCAVDVPSRGCGLVTKEGEICKVGCFCWDWGLIPPTTLWSSVRQHCCCYAVGSLPCNDEFVKEPVCGCCYLQCLPEFGCCLPPPVSPALERLTGEAPEAPAAEKMERSEDDAAAAAPEVTDE